ncbi:MAG: diadenylate cyclase CdaA [Acidobacteriota bacterium]|nr:diadenylate cyclase CdaA [Acidobacteriota bacterium]MDQ7087683.1 diadenylate cyclase CdaA [Acidobacteriota bacterium]
MSEILDFLWLIAAQLTQLRGLLDLLVLWFATYQLMLLIRRTRAVQMVYGLLAVVLLWALTGLYSPLRLQAVNWVLSQVLIYGAFMVIVIFQNPIRQALAQFGRNPFRRFRQHDVRAQIIADISLACSAMGSRRIGALIVLERTHGLKNYIETGIELDARVSYDLLINIFTPKTPLHDGAVIISEGRIKAASCFLPLTTDPYTSRDFGTRHRAAKGVTEETDAVAVVVSEERGKISVAVDGALLTDLDGRALRAFLEEQLGGEGAEGEASPGFFESRSARAGLFS